MLRTPIGESSVFRTHSIAVPGEARVALLPGDGIGPEVIHEAVKVLQAAARRFVLQLGFTELPIGGVATDATGTPLPDVTLQSCLRADAVLLGAVGGPKWDHLPGPARPEAGLLQLRRELGVFANLRPVRLFPSVSGVSPLRAEVAAGAGLLIVCGVIGGPCFCPPPRRAPAGAPATLRYSPRGSVRGARVALS